MRHAKVSQVRPLPNHIFAYIHKLIAVNGANISNFNRTKNFNLELNHDQAKLFFDK